MSLAGETREAVRRRPFLLAALRVGVVNYTAAARFLDVSDETDAVATALRRFEADIPEYATEERAVRVRMESGFGLATDADDPICSVAGTGLVPDEGSLTAVVATGEVDASALGAVLRRLESATIDATAAGVADDALFLAVERRDGPDALRIVEDALGEVPVSVDG